MSSELKLYINTIFFAAVVYILTYFYISFTPARLPLNNAVANTAVFLMGFSMVLSSICYFWNFLDKLIIYRKYLGLVGFAFAVTHVLLYIPVFMALFSVEAWQNDFILVPLTGLVALLIFTVMAVISNKFMAGKIGGKLWKNILRTGYIAFIFVLLHLIFLDTSKWAKWVTEGFPTLPSMSLLISIFILWFLLMRVLLWIALSKKKVVQPLVASVPAQMPPVSTTPAINSQPFTPTQTNISEQPKS